MQVEKKSNWQKDLEKSLVELGWVQFPESEAWIHLAAERSLNPSSVFMHGATWDSSPSVQVTWCTWIIMNMNMNM